MDYPTKLTGSEATKMINGIRILTRAAHANAKEKGFWPAYAIPRIGESIALIHSELSEALEAARHGNPESEKIPGHSHIEEELADAIIRIADLAGYYHYDLAGAILAKMAYNKTRPHRHGKEF